MVKEMKFANRLKFSFGLVVAILLCVSALAVWQMGLMRVSSRQITAKWLPSVERINQMAAGVANLRNTEFQHVLNLNEKTMSAVSQSMEGIVANFEKDRKAYVDLVEGDDERKLYEEFATEWQSYQKLHAQILDASSTDQKSSAKALLEFDSKDSFESLNAKLGKLIAFNHEGAVVESLASEHAYATARNATIVAATLGFVLAFVCSIWLIRSIMWPLKQAQIAADKFATGDMTMKIDVQSQDEVGQVLHALNRMQVNIVEVVTNVLKNSESLATASAEIAQGNQDLSGRTESQAGALQETNASMESLSTQVRHNADLAGTANHLATNASTIATRGGAVVGRVVETMKEINDSSKSISDIIGVIDGIAFQTNILALNAAVEAARAGEQGRGFAVVASEVRSLAGRSAEAAKEIKRLISTSVERVDQGTALIDEAGATMTEIVSSIRHVSDIVREISGASAEQAAGVAQVSEAVSQMDRMTQENAAMVEQMAAAASSLRTQAGNLVQTVSVFKLAKHDDNAQEHLTSISYWTAPGLLDKS